MFILVSSRYKEKLQIYFYIKRTKFTNIYFAYLNCFKKPDLNAVLREDENITKRITLGHSLTKRKENTSYSKSLNFFNTEVANDWNMLPDEHLTHLNKE